MGIDSPQANSSSAQPNDVWSTISKGIDAIAAFRNATGGESRTQASPTRPIGNLIWNPFPGTPDAYPQAQGKPTFGGNGAPTGFGLILLIAAVILGAVFLVRR